MEVELLEESYRGIRLCEAERSRACELGEAVCETALDEEWLLCTTAWKKRQRRLQGRGGARVAPCEWPAPEGDEMCEEPRRPSAGGDMGDTGAGRRQRGDPGTT